MHNCRAAPARGGAIAIGSTLLWLSGCGGGGGSASDPPAPMRSDLPPAVAAAIQHVTPVAASLVTANNSFGFNLLGNVEQSNSGANVFISPASVALALEIAYDGAAGTTSQAMASALQIPGVTAATLNTENAALQASLVSPDPQVTLTVANSLWVHKSATEVLPSFVQANTNYYGATVGDLAGAPDNVNAWVASATNNNITSLLPAGDYSQTAAIIANAIYFKGLWTQKFDPTLTTNSPFTRLDGSTVTCALMHQTGSYSYFQSGGVQAVRLPYGSQRLSMIVVLPGAGSSWSSFLATLTSQSWNQWLTQFHNTYGNVALPRFTSSYKASLKSTLTALGMGVAFDPSNANFSGIGPNLYMQFVYHDTYVQVDESGTTAAGATGVGIAPSLAPVPFNMTINRPFFCAIYDGKTGEILFMGTILDPTA